MSTKRKKKPEAPPVNWNPDCRYCGPMVKQLKAELDIVTSERDGLRHQRDRLSYGGFANGSIPHYEEHLEVLMRVDMASLVVAIGQAREGHPGAQDYSPATSGPTTVFCERCESHQCTCRQGPTSYPAISDRTGELATRLAHRPDVARRDLADADRAKRFVAMAAKILERLHRSYSPTTASAHQRSEAENTPGCKSCARLKIELSDGSEVNRWEPIHRDELCNWCYTWRRKTAKGWPPLDLLRAHHAGKRVTVPVTKAS